MPRYFFHMDDGTHHRDVVGTSLPDLAAARQEAARYAAGLLTDEWEALWAGGGWTLRVTAENDLTLFEMIFLLTEAAAIKPCAR